MTRSKFCINENLIEFPMIKGLNCVCKSNASRNI